MNGNDRCATNCRFLVFNDSSLKEVDPEKGATSYLILGNQQKTVINGNLSYTH